ncbi:hypothetical protein [Paraburkholderia sp. ZP32-5]|uniref:hypothetical protein n=1 Tax=Paraburkholderia sp. ZP32-5 TaxID=2883245 RepID=UPI001F1EA12A|nr:hypothetical protein [Paraburkholderia sp. ZP32-5]
MKASFALYRETLVSEPAIALRCNHTELASNLPAARAARTAQPSQSRNPDSMNPLILGTSAACSNCAAPVFQSNPAQPWKTRSSIGQQASSRHGERTELPLDQPAANTGNRSQFSKANGQRTADTIISTGGYRQTPLQERLARGTQLPGKQPS